MKKIYTIIDIQHSGNTGMRGMSKVGHKYEARKNKKYKVKLDEYSLGDTVILVPCDDKSHSIFTTPLVDFETNGEYTYMETVNSIYVLKEEKYE